MTLATKWFRKIAAWTGIAAAAIAIVFVAFVVGRWTAPAVADDEAAHEPAEAAPDREQWYTCPMHPQVREPNPDDLCPICAMELVPLEDDDDEDEGDVPRLRVSERAAALMNIQTVPARRAAAEREVRLFGRIEPDERRMKTITAWVPGRLEHLHVDFTGQAVRRDEPMVDLYSPMLIAAQEELLQAIEAERRLRDGGGPAARSAQAGVEAARDRLRLLGISPVFIDELETRGEVRDRITIAAPLTGIVTRRFVSEGDSVDVGDRLFAVADLSHLWVELSVFESDLPWLREGQTATLTTPSLPGRTFEGTVAFIDPVLDDRTRSVRARIDLPNEDRRLKPGMFVQGTLRAAMDAGGDAVADAGHVHEQPLIIPASAPLITGRRAVVYVRMPDTDRPTFEPRDVQLGPRAGGMYVVFGGLDEGDLVVVNGQFRIDSELQIRGRPSMMQPLAPEEQPRPLVPHDHPGHAILPQEVPDAFAAQLADVLEEYLALSDSLARDDYDAAAIFAQEMHERLFEINVDLLDDTVGTAWERLDRDLHEVLHVMLEAQDIEALRNPLEPLTEFTALMVAHFIGDRAGTIYRAHCPMVDDNRGADWLQRQRDIANPYFGAMMFRCGEIVGEVIDETHAEQHLEDEAAPDEPEAPDEPVAVDVPDAFRSAASDVLGMYEEIAGTIERGHEPLARDALRTMQDGLLALDLAGLDEATMQEWLAVDVEIIDALSAMIEADSADEMRIHLPLLREQVEKAMEFVHQAEAGGVDSRLRGNDETEGRP